MQPQLAFASDLAQVRSHTLADARNLQQFFLVGNDLADLLRKSFDGFGGTSIGTYAEGVVAADLHQVGSLVKRICDGFVVQAVSAILSRAATACLGRRQRLSRCGLQR